MLEATRFDIIFKATRKSKGKVLLNTLLFSLIISMELVLNIPSTLIKELIKYKPFIIINVIK